MCYRSRFEVLMDVLSVFYEYNNLTVSSLMRKANLGSNRKKEVVDLLIAKGFLGVNNNSFLYLTVTGESLACNLVPLYKKLKGFYFEGFNL